MKVFESITRPKCFEKFSNVDSCSSLVKAALQSERKMTLKSLIAPSRVVLPQQTLVATPVMAMVSRPSRRKMFSSSVP